MVLSHVLMLLELLKNCILLVRGQVLAMLLGGIGGFFLLSRAADILQDCGQDFIHSRGG
jgi:hypothetical protein